ncbi:hypothetical protein LY56_01919 [Roseinatronobacter thiooxidans]|uniref:Uncharacterized protein n=1 Tax=Roseinatronobacter thiooxidans TaxID=121821 RepID=A0A2W7QUY4_9RHOB|nr:hypothetical protein LY56_01919 [Roseinatronobacter thiooxidans]
MPPVTLRHCIRGIIQKQSMNELSASRGSRKVRRGAPCEDATNEKIWIRPYYTTHDAERLAGTQLCGVAATGFIAWSA